MTYSLRLAGNLRVPNFWAVGLATQANVHRCPLLLRLSRCSKAHWGSDPRVEGDIPQVIVLHWTMPRLCGGGFLTALRTRSDQTTHPVVVVTAPEKQTRARGEPCLRMPSSLLCAQLAVDALEGANRREDRRGI